MCMVFKKSIKSLAMQSCGIQGYVVVGEMQSLDLGAPKSWSVIKGNKHDLQTVQTYFTINIYGSLNYANTEMITIDVKQKILSTAR